MVKIFNITFFLLYAINFDVFVAAILGIQMAIKKVNMVLFSFHWMRNFFILSAVIIGFKLCKEKRKEIFYIDDTENFSS